MANGSDDELLQLATDFPAAADYLSTILLIERDYGEVHNTRLSQRLGVSKPAVSQAISRLKHINLVHQDSYKTIELTDDGRALAENIIRRHYLIEHLLIKSVDFPWEDADSEALRLQTVISADLADHLYNAFGQPDVCPHGNPFPGSSVESGLLEARKLTACEPQSAVTVVRITEEGEGVDGLLRFCHEEKIHPGASLTILDTNAGDSVSVRTTDGRELTIPRTFAEHLRVRA